MSPDLTDKALTCRKDPSVDSIVAAIVGFYRHTLYYVAVYHVCLVYLEHVSTLIRAFEVQHVRIVDVQLDNYREN